MRTWPQDRGARRPRADRDTSSRRARRLFAEALETPGGLKIQTIHAFCESVLHQFPLEANIAAHFEVIEDQRQAELLEAARGDTLLRAIHDERGTLARRSAFSRRRRAAAPASPI